jgi:hypothetical protein
MIRAARLDGSLYVEVRADAGATGQALTVVALVAVAHGVGGTIRGASFGENPAIAFPFGALGEIVFFAAASGVIHLFGDRVLGGKATYAQVLRPFGFSVVPGLLILLASLVSLLAAGAQAPVLIVILAWRVAAGYIATRQAIGLEASRSAIALLVGVLSGMVAVVIATRVLFEALRLLGMSS